MPQRTFSFKCCFMHVNPRAYVCLENITWSELGKQSMQAKKVYSASYAGKTLVGHLKNIFYTKLAFFHFKYVYIFLKKIFLSFLNVFLQEEHFHLLSVVLTGLEIATHWSPMRPKLEHWRLNFQNWSPAGDSRFVR